MNNGLLMSLSGLQTKMKQDISKKVPGHPKENRHTQVHHCDSTLFF